MATPDPTTGRPRRPGRAALTAPEVRFCRLVANGGKGYQSYLDAGFAPGASRNATDKAVGKLIRKAQIRAYIRELQDAAADAAKADIEVIGRELGRLAFYDRRKLYDAGGRLLPPHEWPDAEAAAIEGAETDELFDVETDDGGRRRLLVGHTRKVKTAKKVEALRLLMQWRRMIGQDKPAEDTRTDPQGVPVELAARLLALRGAGDPQPG